MSDEQMPAWAKAMEERLGAGIGKLGDGVGKLGDRVGRLGDEVGKLGDEVGELGDTVGKMEERIAARAEAMEHRLVLEISQGIATSEDRTAARIAEVRAEMNRRFDQVHDDLTVNLARADLAVERVQRLEGDVRKELSLLQRRIRELESWRDRHPEVGP